MSSNPEHKRNPVSITGSRKRLLFVITGLSFGGAEVQVANLAIEFVKMGFEVKVVSLLSPKFFVEKLECNGVSVVTLEMRRGSPDIRAVGKLKRIIYQFKPDIVHAHMVHAIILARFVRMCRAKIPVLISTAHNTVDGGFVLKILYRITDRFSEITTNVSRESARNFVTEKLVPSSKMRVVYNGIKISEYLTATSNNQEELRFSLGLAPHFVWLTVGRMDDDQKNIPLLLRTFSSSVFIDSKLLIVGAGVLLDHYKKLSEDLGLGQRVIFLGLRSDIADLMSVTDGFVLASKWEGFPLVLLEAAAAKLPVVCTNVGGNSEIVFDGKTGFLVESENEQELISVMQYVQDIPGERRDAIGLSAYEYVNDNFTLDVISKQWVSIYEELSGVDNGPNNLAV